MTVPDSFIDELLARVDIVELINSFVPLTKAGANFVARCPFHQEKTPSFHVSPSRQRYHCFGCDAKGNAIHFLRAYKHFEFVEAITWLAEQAGLEVPQKNNRKLQVVESQYRDLVQLNQFATLFFQHELQHCTQPSVKAYLAHRGLSADIVNTFCLGYSPAEWDKFLQSAKAHGFTQEQLVAGGLAVQNENGKVYDRFRKRLMFPIRNRKGQVIGFGGRALDDSLPKYLNSPQTPLFHKSTVLYGIYEVLQTQKSIEQLIVVEGYMDVIALKQMGIDNAVATLGTAFTAQHVSQLFRQTSKLVFCFDGDAAGRAAAWKALSITFAQLTEGKSAAFLFLPEGHDPDSLVRAEGKEAWLKRLQSAISADTFLFNQLKSEVDLNTVSGRTQFITQAKVYLDLVPAAILRQMLYEQLAFHTRSQVALLQSGQTTEQKPKSNSKIQLRAMPPVRQAVMILLQHPELATEFNIDALAALDLPGISLLLELIDFIRSHPHITTEEILAAWIDQKEHGLLTKLSNWPIVIPADGHKGEIQDIQNRIRKLGDEQMIKILMKRLQVGELSTEEREKLQQILRNRT